MKPNTWRTSFYLDTKLLDEARAALGTQTMTDTIHAALEDVARRAALRSLAEWEFEYLTLERLEEMRRGGTDDPADRCPHD